MLGLVLHGFCTGTDERFICGRVTSLQHMLWFQATTSSCAVYLQQALFAQSDGQSVYSATAVFGHISPASADGVHSRISCQTADL